MSFVRAPAVAGVFYPQETNTLRAAVKGFLDEAGASPAPKALIAPHAGYPYSGPVAGSAYRSLGEARERVERVVLLGPSHRYSFEGFAASGADAFSTPLGSVPVDRAAVEETLSLPCVHRLEEAFEGEHSLEVHLPFLQETLEAFRLVPLLAGRARPAEAEEVLDALWGGPETLVVISSDLSHYHDAGAARRLDGATAKAIEALRPQDISPEQACGQVAICGLLEAARGRGLRARTLDLRNSADTAGSGGSVVGYGAFALA